MDDGPGLGGIFLSHPSSNGRGSNRRKYEALLGPDGDRSDGNEVTLHQNPSPRLARPQIHRRFVYLSICKRLNCCLPWRFAIKLPRVEMQKKGGVGWGGWGGVEWSMETWKRSKTERRYHTREGWGGGEEVRNKDKWREEIM